MSAAENWNKAQRLAVAAAVAPGLRSVSEKTASRRVAKVDKDGNIVGYTTLAEVQKALLEKQRIEFDVVEGVRPKEVVCQACGRIRKVDRGPIPAVCRFGCDTRCSTVGCEGRISATTAVRRALERKPRVCKQCALRALHAAAAAMTPEQKAEQGRRGRAAMMALTPEERAEIYSARERRTPEQKAESYRAREAKKTPEQKTEARRKAWETRRALAAERKENHE